MEIGIREVGMEKAKGRGSKERSGEGKRRKEEEKETKKGKDSRSKKSSRRVGDMERGRGSGKIGGRSKKVSARKVP